MSNDYVEEIVGSGVQIVGFTCFDVNFRLVRAVSALIKRKKPDIIIVVGGPTATFSSEIIFQHVPEVDIGVCPTFYIGGLFVVTKQAQI